MKKADSLFEEYIEITGAEEHNLKQIDVSIPRNKMTVITGVSGSGKSSLAFDTIYAEGQRRYMETLSSYARQFIAQLDRPKVEQISGLSPVISIEQKRGGWNPRSTVGTITEVYDFMRLLFARIAEAFSHISGEKMIKFTEEQIIRHLSEQFKKKKIVILAPLVKGRKGHYRELFDQVRKQGYTKVRINGEYDDLIQGMKLDRYKTHDIELVIDRLVVDDRKKNRLSESLKSALRMGKNTLLIEDIEASKVFTFSKKLMDPETGISYEEPSPNSFSFNSPYGACPTCKGLGTVNKVDMDKVIPDESKSINQAGIAPFGDVRDNYTFKQLRAIARKYKFTFSAPINEIPEEALNIILHGGDEKFAAKFEKFKHDFVYNLAYEGLTNMLQRWYTETTSESIRSWAERFMSIKPCDTCHGARLRFESLQFKINDKTISDLAQMDLSELNEWFLHLDPHLSKRQKQIGNELIKEIRYRLGFLVQLGLGYLQADRPARTLSGGETQRTRLATQIGSQLSGITYILDEPSIGLHQRDNHRLIEALHGLTEIGNTVIVVEHDKDIMLSSDYLIDLGPGAGKNGGEVVATGSPDHVQQTDSLTSAYLRKILNIDVPKKRRKSNGQAIVLSGASGNNLNDISVRFPLGLMICVTGVSGSGKSSLVSETLYPILRQHLYGSIQNPLPYEKIEGIDLIDKIIEIDQKPIGRTPRSNPATYTNVFTEIRKLYAKVPEAMIRGYKPGRFSFNVKGGRCEICKGSGKKLIEMNFLPNVYVDCDNCHGKRYNRETLEIIYKGKSISDVLNMSIDEGVEFFASIPKIYTKLKTIQEVGLGYITLGQQATTLSGGEAQRVKLAEELSKRATGKTLYILDEPTTGLHFQDIVHLLEVLGKLTKKGNTIIIIEHNMDVIKMADYIIDLGPGGGREGGNIVVSGTPEQVVKVKNGFTWQYLAEEL